jgi:hypothetical protein
MGTEPVWALLVGVVLAREPIGPLGLVGAAIIVAAGYAGQAIERRHREGTAGEVAPAEVTPPGPSTSAPPAPAGTPSGGG